MKITVETLQTSFHRIEEHTAREIVAVIECTDRDELLEGSQAAQSRERECHSRVPLEDLQIHTVDTLLGTHGVEAIGVDGWQGNCQPPRYEYCNTGDSYASTIARDVESGEWEIACYADLVETIEKGELDDDDPDDDDPESTGDFTAHTDDGSGHHWAIHADSLSAALEIAVGDTEGGDYDNATSTIWVTVTVTDDVTDDSEDESVTIDPDEPECKFKGGHDWQQEDSVRPSGGGIKYSDVCTWCSARKDTDTWAQNPSNGEQGLTSVSYPVLVVDDCNDDAQESDESGNEDTTARRILIRFGNDGQCWEVDGIQLLDVLCGLTDCQRVSVRSSHISRWLFEDGSAIITGNGAWDVEGKREFSWEGNDVEPDGTWVSWVVTGPGKAEVTFLVSDCQYEGDVKVLLALTPNKVWVEDGVEFAKDDSDVDSILRDKCIGLAIEYAEESEDLNVETNDDSDDSEDDDDIEDADPDDDDEDYDDDFAEQVYVGIGDAKTVVYAAIDRSLELSGEVVCIGDLPSAHDHYLEEACDSEPVESGDDGMRLFTGEDSETGGKWQVLA